MHLSNNLFGPRSKEGDATQKLFKTIHNIHASRRSPPYEKPLPGRLMPRTNRTYYDFPGLTLQQTNNMNRLVKDKTPSMRAKIAKFYRRLGLYQLQALEWQRKKTIITKQLKELVKGTGLNSKLNNALAN
jgi:hypothetical protein